MVIFEINVKFTQGTQLLCQLVNFHTTPLIFLSFSLVWEMGNGISAVGIESPISSAWHVIYILYCIETSQKHPQILSSSCVRATLKSL